MSDNPMTVLVVEPMKTPYAKEIAGDLASMQALVGGTIQALYPFEDRAALVCNDYGKLLNLPPNRFLEDDAGRPYDIICGPFFVVGLGEDDFKSLTAQQIKTYEEKYRRGWLIAAPKEQKKGKDDYER